MIFAKNLKKLKQFNNTIFLYNDEIVFSNLKNYVILLNNCHSKKIVFIDTKMQYILYANFFDLPDCELIKFFYDKDFEIIFTPWLTEKQYAS